MSNGHLKKHIILVDLENVQPRDVAQLRGGAVTTMVFCGANQNRIPFDLVAELQPYGRDAEYIRIQGTGRNALDFHIAFYIGRLAVEIPDAAFHIVSKDTGFDPLIRHLETKKISCERVSSLSEIRALASSDSAPLQKRVQKIPENLLNRTDARPRTIKTLIAYIKGQLNAQANETSVNEAIELLKQRGVCILPDGKVTYPAK